VPRIALRSKVALRRTDLVLVAVGCSGWSFFLLGWSAFYGLLACGDDGPVDYGTSGFALEGYCRIVFDDRGFSSAVNYGVLVLIIAIGIVQMLLITTRSRLWLYASLAHVAVITTWATCLTLFFR
jgi:hypothetical protein